jgi:opacity protein-like surface antigen
MLLARHPRQHAHTLIDRFIEETAMKLRHLILLVPLAAIGTAAHAERTTGWEYGAELIYQDSQDIDFEGGSFASLDDDLGLALAFGYRFNSRFDLQFRLDWNTVDYDITVAPGSTGVLGFSAKGDLESFTPRVAINFNVFEGDLTPYISGGVGWSFIDTNIPDAPPQTTCWWDPWWGYYCGTFQSTRSIDELAYDLGVGARWDVSDTLTLKLGYEKHWLDLGEATSTPGFDQIRFGIYARY